MHNYPLALLSLGDHLRKRRIDMKLRQQDLADRFGVGQQAIAQWELGRNAQTSECRAAIIEFLGYDPGV